MKPPAKSIDRDFIRQVCNLTAILAALGANTVTNIAPIKGLTIGQISNTLFKDVLITPANYAFAIWGLIYLGLVALGVYQLLPAQRENQSLRQMGYLLVMSSLAQIAWVFVFLSRLFPLSLLMMLAIMLPLVAIYLRLDIGSRRSPRSEKWLVRIPLSIYLGWISVATIVNVAIVLYDAGWNGWGISPEVWTTMMMFAATAIAAIVGMQRNDLAFPLVIVWALVAIAVRHSNTLLISGSAGILAIALILLLLFKPLLRRK